MKRHYKCKVIFSNHSMVECFVPLTDRAFYDIKCQVADWLLDNYSDIHQAYITQKSSKRPVNERVI
jgi:hypothetical protein